MNKHIICQRERILNDCDSLLISNNSTFDCKIEGPNQMASNLKTYSVAASQDVALVIESLLYSHNII